MIVRRGIRFGLLLSRGWKTIALFVVYSILVVSINKMGYNFRLPTSIPALVGTLLSILLGFRTNSAYQRWWEARKIWGAIVNDSRTFARQVLALFVPADDETVRALQQELVYRQVGSSYAQTRLLRKQDPLQDLGPFLPSDEIERLKPQKSVPNAMLETQALRLADARAAGTIDGFAHIRLDGRYDIDNITNFSDGGSLETQIP